MKTGLKKWGRGTIPMTFSDMLWVENMERPARDCKDRHKPILLMRHGGA